MAASRPVATSPVTHRCCIPPVLPNSS
jgi:hypothetical protein